MNFENIKNECKKYGFEAVDLFGDVVIKTKFEQWKFTPTNGKTTLYHKGCIGKNNRHTGNEYHIEFKEYINLENLIRYMYEHESSKYTKYGKPFTVNIKAKEKQYKKMKEKEFLCMI